MTKKFLNELHNFVGVVEIQHLLNEDIYKEWTRVDCPEDRSLGFHLNLELQIPKATERNKWLSENCPGFWHTPNSISYYFRNPNDAMLYKLSGL